MLEERARAKGLQLVSEVDAMPGNLIGDRNAIKFTERGILVHPLDGAAPAAHESPQPWCFTVADTGIGIDAGTQARLFQRFSQGDDSRSRRFGGTGLGLEISRALARRMGGDITVSSVPGEGSRFTFRVPLALPHDPDTGMAASVGASAAQRPPPRLRVLVAEDNEVNRVLIGAVLQRLGIQPVMAVDGDDALQQIQARPFDLILMDIQMPGHDGLSLTRHLRTLPLNPQPRVVAITANVFAEDRAACLAAGMDGFLAKPFRLADLIALVGEASVAAISRAADPGRP